MKRIEELNLYRNNLTSIEFLYMMPTLKKVDVRENKIDNFDILNDIDEINIFQIPYVSDTFIFEHFRIYSKGYKLMYNNVCKFLGISINTGPFLPSSCHRNICRICNTSCHLQKYCRNQTV